VILTILHDKSQDPVEIKVVRAVITIPTIDTKTVNGKDSNDKIFVISLYNFSISKGKVFITFGLNYLLDLENFSKIANI
jgi:C-terminal processing protease CtpA/Prc